MRARNPYRTSDEVQLLILQALRDEPGHYFLIAQAVEEAPYRVRGELKALKRRRLVRERLTTTEHSWTLTDSGYGLLLKRDQLELT